MTPLRDTLSPISSISLFLYTQTVLVLVYQPVLCKNRIILSHGLVDFHGTLQPRFPTKNLGRETHICFQQSQCKLASAYTHTHIVYTCLTRRVCAQAYKICIMCGLAFTQPEAYHIYLSIWGMHTEYQCILHFAFLFSLINLTNHSMSVRAELRHL